MSDILRLIAEQESERALTHMGLKDPDVIAALGIAQTAVRSGARIRAINAGGDMINLELTSGSGEVINILAGSSIAAAIIGVAGEAGALTR